jgi:hypothetical protein
MHEARIIGHGLEVFQERLWGFGGAIGEEPIHAGEDIFFGDLAHDAKDR